MPDEPKNSPDDIQDILSDLDSILSDLGGTPSTPPKPAEPPKPAPAAPPPADLKIELAPREGTLPPPAKKPEPTPPPAAKTPAAPLSRPPLELGAGPSAPPPKPAAPPKPVEAPKPTEPAKPAEPAKAAEPPKPAAAPAPAEVPAKAAAPASDEIPANTPKDQIRRVAYAYTASCAEARAAFATFLSQAARTISKKPLFLRQVWTIEVGAASDPNAVFEKARDAKASALLAVLDGWPPAKVDALSEACSRGGMLFRSVAPGDVQKKSTAVDVIVDMMLLPGEA